MNLTTPSTAGTITGRPWITLVDAEGYEVPPGEKNIPEPFEPDSAEEWGAWADACRFELGPFPDDAPDADPAIAFPGIAPLAERTALAPVCGGSDEAQPYEPTEADWEDYRAWAAEIEARAALARMSDPLYGWE